MKKRPKAVSQARLKEIAWEIGKNYPIALAGDHITLLMVKPRHGYVQWQIQAESVETLKATHVKAFNDARLVVRIHDVTDIVFDGFNAHKNFDLEINGFSGNYYFHMDQVGRNCLAEVGFRFKDGSFHFLARSNTAFFDRDRPSGNYQLAGLFVGWNSGRIFPVENMFDAPVYERMVRELSGMDRKEPLSVAVVFLDVSPIVGSDGVLGSFIEKLCRVLEKFGGQVRFFMPSRSEVKAIKNKTLIGTIDTLSKETHKQLITGHQKEPFHVIHCHDWYSSKVGMSAAKKLNVPMILTLHSTEYQRTQGKKLSRLASTISAREKKGVLGADLIIVPDSTTHRQVTTMYGGSPERVVIIPDALTEEFHENYSNASEVKRWFGLDETSPVVLFAGEMSHASGADLLVDALPTVCRNHSKAQFVFAGQGPLKDELEGRTWHAGIGHRCRFVGHVPEDKFEALLVVSDFVVIPARTWQDQELARMAIGFGKPILATHQAGLDSIVHGENGLVTFDNPGSIVWGIQELLFNPLGGNMLRLVARKKASETPSLDNIAAQHYIYYEKTLNDFRGAKNA